jgi:hypothetical protein
VTLLLVNSAGTVLGSLAPFMVETPWWMDIGPVVEAVRAQHRVNVVVLRILATEKPSPHGGAVTYLAQINDGDATLVQPLQPSNEVMVEHPKRMPYAKVNGPAEDLTWAVDVLRAHKRSFSGAPMQQRTWNLSSIWKIPTELGPVWLKVVPPFFAHEGAVIRAISRSRPQVVPYVLGNDGARLLLDDVAGTDRYDAPIEERMNMIDLLVSLQHQWMDRIDELRLLELPDWSDLSLCSRIDTLISRHMDGLARNEKLALSKFVEGLAQRFIALEECGIPDTLLHGDFHPGNVCGSGPEALTIMDWGDSGIGHPMLDQPAMLSASDPRFVTPLQHHWSAAWSSAIPGCDPNRAARLLAPVAAARQALVYQKFLDGIEDSEHRYHAGDVSEWLRRCVNELQIAM